MYKKYYPHGLFGRRGHSHEMTPEDESNNNNNKARSRRRSLLPASELHLEVPCFGVRAPGMSTSAQATESSRPGDSDERVQTEMSTDSYCCTRHVGRHYFLLAVNNKFGRGS